jgi:ataxia telangiectasia mutated family protein
MIQLGEVRHRLGKTGGGEMEMGQMTAAAIDSWLISQIPSWIASETLRDSLDFAMAFWPNEVTAMFENWREPNFVDLAFIADTRRSKSFSSMTLCSGLARGMPIGNREEHIDAFVKHVFWHLKATLAEDTCTTEGVAGLLDLLAQVDGEIHAPDLSTANELSIDEVRAKYDQKLAGEPALMLRAILIGKVADLTQDKVYTLRSTALEVLRRSYATIHELLQRGVFQGTSHPRPLLELLLPVDVPKNVSLSNLDVLGQTDSWIRRSRSSESWASRLSLLFCEVLAADDPFYRSFIPLLDLSAKTASDFLPWFVQALLTVGSAKRVEVAEQRSSILSAYFTKVIQWSAASKNAIATIIKTVLHLRGFVPGFRTGVMAFNSWLEIDPVLLSEAAIKCGAFATAMLFLEILKDIRDDQVDLLDPRIQNVGHFSDGRGNR